MRDSWLTLIDSVLRPARDLARVERCLKARTRHLEARRSVLEGRARAVAHCEARIEAARARVFAADNGVVGALMTDLEREWRTLTRPDPDAGLMDLWARIAPPAWIDRKRWRDGRPQGDPEVQLDVALALAADVEGVETAEAAIDALRAALAPWGTPFGAQVRWRAFERDVDATEALLVEPLRAAREALAVRDRAGTALDRASRLEQEVHDAAQGRFPERPALARALAHAAFVDDVWRAAVLADRPNPVTPLRDLWKTGYVLSAFESGGAAVEVPPL